MVLRLLRRLTINKPFALSLLPIAAFYVILFNSPFIPYHDTFYYLHTAYSFINEYVTTGNFQFWYPYDNMGMPNNQLMTFIMVPSLFLLKTFAVFLYKANFIKLFYAGMFLCELVLACGTFLLAGKIVKSSYSRVFVTIAMTGSSLWYDQVGLNFIYYYMLPLSLYHMQEGLEQSSLWRIIISYGLLIVGIYGAPFYLLPVQSVLVSLFFMAGLRTYGFSFSAAFRKIGVREIIAALLFVLITAIYLTTISYGADQLGGLSTKRLSDGSVDLKTYLNYAGLTGLVKYTELFSGVKFAEISVYSGLLVTAFALFALIWKPDKSVIPFVVPAVIAFLLSLGPNTIVAPLFYNIPLFKYYRHIGYIMVVFKMFMVFVAGIGFERFICYFLDSKGGTKLRRLVIDFNMKIVLMLMLMCVLYAVLQISYFRSFWASFFAGTISPAILYPRLSFMILIYVVVMAVLLAFKINRGLEKYKVLIITLVIIEFVDIYAYRYAMYDFNMPSVDKEQEQMFYLGRKLPYQDTRKSLYAYDEFKPFSASGLFRGVLYSTFAQFLGVDICNESPLRKNLSSGDVAYLEGIKKASHPKTTSEMLIKTITSCGYDKLRIFRTLQVVKDNDVIQNPPQGLGDDCRYFFATVDSFKAYERSLKGNDSNTLSDSLPEMRIKCVEPLDASVSVTRFTSNSLETSVETPATQNHYWLYYSDTWHVGWDAYVNGRHTPILKANVAFKAIEVPSGKSSVRFEFSPPRLKFNYAFIWVQSVLFIVYVLWLTFKSLFYKT